MYSKRWSKPAFWQQVSDSKYAGGTKETTRWSNSPHKEQKNLGDSSLISHKILYDSHEAHYKIKNTLSTTNLLHYLIPLKWRISTT